jgi:DNA (cytosine-5)-methyltransferase 1
MSNKIITIAKTNDMNNISKKVAIDLFAGGGGLSLGLRQAGFCVSAAVEIDESAAKTYEANHKGTVLFHEDIRKIKGNQLIKTSPTGKIDFVAGCPPCQGFSQLTAKYHREDLRNQLILEYARIVKEIKPTSFMLENVPGLPKKGLPLLEQALAMLNEEKYEMSMKVLDVADYGIPQRRKRFVLLGCLHEKIEIPPQTHSLSPTMKKIKPWVTVKDAFSSLNLSEAVTIQNALEKGTPQQFNWHIVRTLSPINKARLKSLKPGAARFEMPEYLRPACHKNKNSGFSNVYGRMSWNNPSPTITGGCVTLSKGRFGHPSLLRTISIREAAALQGFPSDYVFDTKNIDRAAQIIGNALPPRFARILSSACLNHINKYE